MGKLEGAVQRNFSVPGYRQTHTRYDADMNDHFCCRLGVDQYYTAQLVKQKMTFESCY